MLSNEFQQIIDYRRSNRKFDTAIPVPEEVMKKSLERTLLSPNSSNMQLWEFYWIRSEEMKKKFVLDENSNILETVENYPNAGEIFAKRGIPCLGCASARFEKLSDIAGEFGIDVEDLIKEIKEGGE